MSILQEKCRYKIFKISVLLSLGLILKKLNLIPQFFWFQGAHGEDVFKPFQFRMEELDGFRQSQRTFTNDALNLRDVIHGQSLDCVMLLCPKYWVLLCQKERPPTLSLRDVIYEGSLNYVLTCQFTNNSQRETLLPPHKLTGTTG